MGIPAAGADRAAYAAAWRRLGTICSRSSRAARRCLNGAGGSDPCPHLRWISTAAGEKSALGTAAVIVMDKSTDYLSCDGAHLVFLQARKLRPVHARAARAWAGCGGCSPALAGRPSRHKREIDMLIGGYEPRSKATPSALRRRRGLAGARAACATSRPRSSADRRICGEPAPEPVRVAAE
jgi:hypothetical protein